MGILTAHPINPSTVFSTFYLNKLTKIHRHHWRERLEIGEVAEFGSDGMKTKNDVALQSRKFL